MRVGFFVNDLGTEKPEYTTTRLAMTARNMGHESWHISVDDFAYGADNDLYAVGHAARNSTYRSLRSYLSDLRGRNSIVEELRVDDLDVLMLRNDPSEDIIARPWAQSVGIIFGQLALRHGVIVLNDPIGLSKALNKLYSQFFPESIRPRTVITRNAETIREFVHEMDGRAIFKPLEESGEQNTITVRNVDEKELDRLIQTVIRNGYVVVQEYLPAEAKGEVRLFLMNGNPMIVRGKYAAFRRSPDGRLAPIKANDAMLHIADVVRPKLVQDGMFLVGLDIAGDKLMHINVFSPGGLGLAQKAHNVNFAHSVIESLETKVRYMRHYSRNFDNTEMATL